MTDRAWRKSRVVHMLAPAPFGGLESVVRQLARAQARVGAEVTVAALVEHASHPFVTAARGDGVAVRAVEVPSRAYARERAAVAALLRELAPDVVHTHGYRADVLDAPVARTLRIPTVATVHGFVGNGPRNRFYEWLQRRSLRRADAVVAVSRPLVGDLARSGIPAERVRLILNAWEPTAAPLPRAEARRALALAGEAMVVGFVGRLGPEKAPETLVRALADPRLSRVSACFVGTGRAEADLRALARAAEVEDRIAWKGALPDAGQLMAAFDVLCVPSRTEGTPIVVFEAAAAGVPVVASAVGGLPDLLGEGFNLVPAGDPSALAGALAHALSAAGAAEAIERAARRIRTDFGVEGWVERHLDLYRELRHAPRRSRHASVGSLVL